MSESIEKNLELCTLCYANAKEALQHCSLTAEFGSVDVLSLESSQMDSVKLIRRIGNVKNELGVYYMNMADHMLRAAGSINNVQYSVK